MSNTICDSIEGLKQSVDGANEFNQAQATELATRHNQTISMLNIQYRKVPKAIYKEL